MDSQGPKLLDWFEQVCQVDAEWRVREPRALTWWPWRLRQTLAAQPARQSREASITRITVTTPFAVDVPDGDGLDAIIAAGNMQATYSAMVHDPATRTLRIGTAFAFHDENEAWLRGMLGIGSVLQVAVAGGVDPDSFGKLGFGRPDLVPHPVSGSRAVPDDMLNLVAATQQAGQNPRPIASATFDRAAALLGEMGMPVRPQDDAIVVPYPQPHLGKPASILVMPNQHPGFGNGLFVLSTPPTPPKVRNVGRYANALNLRELAEPVDHHMLGAWTQGPKEELAHVGFITADALAIDPEAQAIVIVNLVLNEFMRLKWLDETWGATLG